MITFLPLFGFLLLLTVGGLASDWLDSRAKGGRKAIKELAAHKEFLDRLEEQAREFRDIDNFAAITVQEIAAFRKTPTKEINK